jgi:hypothetical protein
MGGLIVLMIENTATTYLLSEFNTSSQRGHPFLSLY